MNSKFRPRHVMSVIYWRSHTAFTKIRLATESGTQAISRAVTQSLYLDHQTIARYWPHIFRRISWINDTLPGKGWMRQTFVRLVWTSPFEKFYRLAYLPEKRDVFFEHIVTFYYHYPIKKGDVVVQVGASSGEEAIRFARAVGPEGRLIAVEPEQGNLEKLRAKLPKSKFPQVSIIPKGAWKESGILEFYVGGEKEHRIADLAANKLTYEWWGVSDHLDATRYGSVTQVAVDTVDNIVAAEGLDAIDFVSFETNGAELEGVQGMTKSLKIAKRIAARGHVMRDGVPIWRAIEQYLKDNGFRTSVTSEGMVLAHRPKS